jgi:hypothetical protein
MLAVAPNTAVAMFNRYSHSQSRTRRSARGLVAALALILITSNTLAAMGLCIAKAPAALGAVSAPAGDEAPCPQHVADESAGSLTTDPAPPTHCPQDDPGAQARAGADVPCADLPIISVQVRALVAPATCEGCGEATDNDSPQTPLYARLSRLLL